MSREIELAQSLWENEQKRKVLEKEVAELKKAYADTTEELIEFLVEEGKSSTGHIQGVGEFKLAPQSFLSVNKDNMPLFIQDVKKRGDGAIVKETIEANTLKAYLKERHEQLCDELRENDGLREEIAFELGVDLEEVSISELAAKHLTKAGASQFTTTKLSHTKKGK